MRAAEKRLRRAQSANIDDGMRRLCETREGRAFLWDLFAKTSVLNTPYTGDTNSTMFKLGEQNIGLQLLAHMQETTPNAYLTMMEEGKADVDELMATQGDDDGG